MKSLSFLLITVLLILNLLVAVLSADKYSRYDFPPGFIFGSATTAYQVEGAASEDGRTPSIWDTFVHAGYADGATGDVAVDQYHKYKEDVKLMAEMGLDAYRFSISWSRLIPNGRGSLNPKGIQYYNNLIDELISHGMQLHVSLNHADLPQALEDEYGGWINRKIVKDFTAYADVCFREFGDRGNSSSEPYIAVHNILLAHASAARLYRRKYQEKQNGFIGISIYTLWAVPNTNSKKDAMAAQRMNEFYIGWIANPLVFGDYPDTMKKSVGSRIPTLPMMNLNLFGVRLTFLELYITQHATSKVTLTVCY
ncbi:hypothetical protein DITRI_Ditri11bG0108300 [Diplodiscus trichospermus]